MDNHIHLIGLNHKTAPVEVREKVAVSSFHLKEALDFFCALNIVSEVAILSTCNRTEIYTVGQGFESSFEFLQNYFGVWFSDIEKYLYRYSGIKAVEHLMRVAAGLDSMIVGEGQVLGQVKEAWNAALKTRATGPILNTVFNRAVNCGKRGRSETKVSHGAVSVGSAAVELAKKIFGNLKLKQVLIIGAGKMSETAAKLLDSQIIFVANRTFFRAQELASKVNGQAVKFDSLNDYISTCDIIISSTGSSHHILTKQRIQGVIGSRGGNPLFLIDIAVPRDIDPRVGELPQVYLYDIDDLNAIAAENLKERQAEIPKVERIIEEEKQNLLKWWEKRPSKKKSSLAHAEAALH